MRRLWALFEAERGTPDERRVAERDVRRSAVAFTRAHLDISYAEASEALSLSERTLRSWDASWKEDRLACDSRGRPTKDATEADRTRLLGLLWVLGPTTGYETLRPYLPDVGRHELRRILRTTRKVWKRLDRVGALALSWTRPGAVWAMDFTDAPLPIEGRYPRILLVRDLSSGATLLALPCEDETARTTVEALRALFLQHGAPLVLKADNGSAFIAGVTKALCFSFGVTLLYSPPYYPAYNGACEAGVGAIKTRVHFLSARAGRAGEWTLDDVEGARLMANETGRPFGANGPVPEVSWNERRPIDDVERDFFLEDVARSFDAETTELRHTLGREPDPVERASCDRAAIARTLCEHKLLEFKTRRVSLPITSLFSAIFS